MLDLTRASSARCPSEVENPNIWWFSDPLALDIVVLAGEEVAGEEVAGEEVSDLTT